MSLTIGPYCFPNRLVLAPMAGVTDRPFRQLCRQLGAGMTVSEMISSKPELRDTRKSRLRRDHSGEPGPIIVQIAGADPMMMADAARYNVDCGAQIIDINMGCPAKKVCRVDAGSALMRDEKVVARILSAVVDAVDVPVTLKIRTGWSAEHRNAPRIATIAEDCGIQALAVHGRTRDQKYFGSAEYETIQSIKQRLSIPLIANGDIDSPQKAKMVMDFTGSDAIMIARAAQSKPWVFSLIDHYLKTGQQGKEPDLITRKTWLMQHLENLYEFYGDDQGVLIARKHIIWQLGGESCFTRVKHGLLSAVRRRDQMGQLNQYFDQLMDSQFDRAS